jgi:hypothetical protein
MTRGDVPTSNITGQLLAISATPRFADQLRIGREFAARQGWMVAQALKLTGSSQRHEV